MKKLLIGSLLSLSFSPLSFAATYSYSVDVQNLTRGSYFTPLLVAAHPAGNSLFSSGMAASANLQAMAEGGDISGLNTDVLGLDGQTVVNPAEGLLAPGASTMADLGELDSDNTTLSIVAMILPSNDGFVGLNGLKLPTMPGTYTYWLNAYDSGTEANDEIRGSGASGEAGMPVPPPLEAMVGMDGTGVPGVMAEGFVHIHRGVLGDSSATDGMSDIDASNQRWLNPVARITVIVE